MIGLPVAAGSPVRSAPVGVPWHLDRLDQVSLPLDGSFARPALTGVGVDVYVVDTGVRATHEQFGDRVRAGIDIPTLNRTSVVSPPSSDCDGHGTHVAGLVAGATTGLASGARVWSVRVLDCAGDGEIDDVVRALRWVRAHHRSPKPAVMNLSLGVDLGDDGSAIDREVSALIREGVTVTVAAGNGDGAGRPIDACRIAPADVPGALTVGAVGITDQVTDYSNYGRCVDILAPGGTQSTPVVSAWHHSDSDYGSDIGTSMASPLVAGYAALLLGQQRRLCPDTVFSAVTSRAVSGQITGLDAATPDRLLHLDTSPVPVNAPPGAVSHVVMTADNGVLDVSWDVPCNNEMLLESTSVVVLHDGRVYRRVEVPRGVNRVRVGALRNGLDYRVVLRARNAAGFGPQSGHVPGPRPRRLAVGSRTSLSALGTVTGGLALRWSVTRTSRGVCTIRGPRLVAVRAGICRVALRTIAEQAPVVHTITIGS